MKKLITLLFIFILLCSCGKKTEEADAAITHEGNEASVAETYAELNKSWDENYAINNDYIGELTVGELLTCPFVQGRTNDAYLRRGWQTMNYDEEGSVFLDSRNSLDDQNLIIYGHYVYASYDASGTHKFTPLRLLTEEENYEANRYITLQLQDEIRTYEIALVLYVDTYVAEDGLRYTVPELQYDHTDFGDYFDIFITNAEAAAFYDTGIRPVKNDRLLTLQTCVEGNEDLREIVVARLINTVNTR